MKLMILGFAMVLSYPIILCIEIGLILFCGYPEILSRNIEMLLFMFMPIGILIIWIGVINVIEKNIIF